VAIKDLAKDSFLDEGWLVGEAIYGLTRQDERQGDLKEH
jgi:hypothetical protein